MAGVANQPGLVDLPRPERRVPAGTISAASEGARGTIELATQAETDTGSDDTRAVTPLKLNDRAASESLTGILELATQAETDTGTDNARAVTPLKLIRHPASPSHPGYAANLYYPSIFPQYNVGGAAVTDDVLYLTPFLVGVTTTFTRIGLEVTSLSAGAARLGIYNFTDGLPGTLVLDAGTINTGSAAVLEVTISQELFPGWYFLAVVFNATPSVRFGPAPTTFAVMAGWGFNGAPGNVGEFINKVFTYAALPTPFGTPTYTTLSGPLMHMRVV